MPLITGIYGLIVGLLVALLLSWGYSLPVGLLLLYGIIPANKAASIVILFLPPLLFVLFGLFFGLRAGREFGKQLAENGKDTSSLRVLLIGLLLLLIAAGIAVFLRQISWLREKGNEEAMQQVQHEQICDIKKKFSQVGMITSQLSSDKHSAFISVALKGERQGHYDIVLTAYDHLSKSMFTQATGIEMQTPEQTFIIQLDHEKIAASLQQAYHADLCLDVVYSIQAVPKLSQEEIQLLSQSKMECGDYTSKMFPRKYKLGAEVCTNKQEFGKR